MILAGGESLRLKQYIDKPKQFQKLISNKTMLEYTLNLYKPVVNDSIIVTLNKYKNEIKKIVSKSQKVLYEPSKKGTLYQILTLLQSKYVEQNDILIITPSDHYFGNQKVLHDVIKTQINISNDKIVLLGTKIDKNNINTQYGWIHVKNNKLQINDISIYDIDTFIEKPYKERQEMLLSKDENYLYNMGIFIGKVKSFYNIISKQNYSYYRYLLDVRFGTVNLKRIYNTLQEKSFDKEILENVQNDITVINADYKWDDIGLIKNLNKVKQVI